MPLGGIGAGFLLLDERGRLFNHIPATGPQGALMPNTAACVRIQTESGRRYLRTLCGKSRDGEGPAGASYIPCLPAHHYQSHFQYPNASFHLCDSEAPATITWSYFSPIIPYDHVAAAMPVVIMGVNVKNTASEQSTVTVLFTYDTFRAGGMSPENDSLHAVRLVQNVENDGGFFREASRGSIAGLSSEAIAAQDFNGLIFGERRGIPGTTLHPHACLATKRQGNAAIQVSGYSPAIQEEQARFWEVFLETGELPRARVSFKASVGAVSVCMTLPPGASHRYDFAFAWHVPGGDGVAGDFSAGYSRSFKSAQDTAQYALRYVGYMVAAIEKWHHRLMAPKLPADFGRILIDCSRAFTTHTRHTRSGGFMFVGEISGVRAGIPWDFFAGMAVLAFVPYFYTNAVTYGLHRVWGPVKNGDIEDTPAMLCETAQLILSAYADIHFLGHRARMAEWLPIMHGLVEVVLDKARSDFSSPDAMLSRFSLEGLGLWAGAMSVMAGMVREAAESGAAGNYTTAADMFHAHYEACLFKILPGLNRGEIPARENMELVNASVLSGPCCIAMFGLKLPQSLENILVVLMQAFGTASYLRDGMGETDHAMVVKLLCHIFFTKSGGKAGNQIPAMLRDMREWYMKVLREGDAQGRWPISSSLTIWSILQMLSGFYYDAIHQTVMLRPPVEQSTTIQLPIFSPLSLGSLTVKKDPQKENRFKICFSVETPLTISSIIVALKIPVMLETVSCMRDSELVEVRQETVMVNNKMRMVFSFKSPQKMVNSFQLQFRELIDNRN